MQITRTPYILEIDGVSNRKDNLIRKTIKKLIISKASTVFSPSKDADNFFRMYNYKKEIIRYPFTSLNKNDILEKPLSINEKISYRQRVNFRYKINILFVGRLIPWKRC